MSRPFLEIVQLEKSFNTSRGKLTVLSGFDLNIQEGKFVSIIGHSGCGKSTVLSMVAGLVEPSDGNIVVGNREIEGPGPDRAVVFQSPSLFPWMSAMENVMIGVEQVFPQATKSQRRDMCAWHLSRVGLGDDLEKKASDLSQGQRQRVGIARAFALRPRVLLLDEPFGMLDALTRAELQEVLLDVWARDKITAMMITHDVDEALFLSDEVVMMTSGPYARVGEIVPVNLPRPRVRREVLGHPDYYRLRRSLLEFLEGPASHSPGAPPAKPARNAKAA